MPLAAVAKIHRKVRSVELGVVSIPGPRHPNVVDINADNVFAVMICQSEDHHFVIGAVFPAIVEGVDQASGGCRFAEDGPP